MIPTDKSLEESERIKKNLANEFEVKDLEHILLRNENCMIKKGNQCLTT